MEAQSRSCGFWLKNVAFLICSEGLSLTETKRKFKAILAPVHAAYKHQLPWGTGKGIETQRKNLEREGKGPHTPGFMGNAAYALIFANLPSHTFVLAFTVLRMLKEMMQPQVLLPWCPSPCIFLLNTPLPPTNTAAHPRTLLAMLKASNPRKTIPLQDQWNIMFKSNNKACVY